MMVPGAVNALMFGGSSANSVGAADFDGSNDYMTRGAGLTGASDTKKFSISFWFNGAAVGGGRILINNSTRVNVSVGATSNMIVTLTSAAAEVFQFSSGLTTIANSAWRWIGISADTNFSAGNKVAKISVDGVTVSPTVTIDASAAFDIDFTDSNWGIGATDGGAGLIVACIAELWSDFTTAQDFSSAGVVSKFYSGGHPVNLGPTGALPTGSQPIIYQRVASGAAASTFATNLGGGGNFSVTGALTSCATTP